MKYPFRSLTAALAASVLLIGCTANAPAPAPPTQRATPAVQTLSMPAPEVQAAQSDPMTEKYIDVLEGIYYDYALPDGTRLDPFEETEEYYNEFAIFDIDSDGEDELLIRYSNTYMAGMFGAVYGYDRASGKLTTQLFEFPAMSFFPNGAVEVGWSHNQGLAGRFWPCTLYQYDPASDAYLPAACVDAWDREIFETDFEGNPFPAEADPDGDNIVYYVYLWGEETSPTPICQKEFQSWYNDFVDCEPALNIPFQPLTEESIIALS